MADYRPIKISIWDDDWFYSLNTEEKLVWIFLLTNKNLHISGIYQLPKPLVSPLTGVKDAETILAKFEADGKIVMKNGWVFLRNYLKNQIKQFKAKDNIVKSIIAYLGDNPQLVTLFSLQDEAPYKPLVPECQTPSLKGKEERVKIKDEMEMETENSANLSTELSPHSGDNSPRSRMMSGLDRSKKNLVHHLDMNRSTTNL